MYGPRKPLPPKRIVPAPVDLSGIRVSRENYFTGKAPLTQSRHDLAVIVPREQDRRIGRPFILEHSFFVDNWNAHAGQKFSNAERIDFGYVLDRLRTKPAVVANGRRLRRRADADDFLSSPSQIVQSVEQCRAAHLNIRCETRGCLRVVELFFSFDLHELI